MKRQISSKTTFISKILMPVFVMFFWGAATLAIIFESGTNGQPPLPLPMKFIAPALWLAVGAIMYWLLARLKTVSIDDDFLYISNYLKEISVPFSNIREVTESLLRGHPVTIHFKSATAFGSKITFIPKMRFLDFSSHPVVGELKKLAKKHDEQANRNTASR